MLGQIRDLISVRGPNSFVYRNKKNTTRITLVTFVFFCLFSLLVNMFAMWFMNLLLLFHNSCRLIIVFFFDAAIRRVTCNSFYNCRSNAYASHSKCPLRLSVWFRSTDASQCSVDRSLGAKHMYNTRLPGPDESKMHDRSSIICQIASEICQTSRSRATAVNLVLPGWVKAKLRCYFGTKPGSAAHKYCLNLQQCHVLL